MACSIPDHFDDASQFRQVPDHQEVFTQVSTGVCVIVELVSRAHDVSNEECGVFFFTDLAQSNKSEETLITLPQRELDPSELPFLSCGERATGQSTGCEYCCIIGGTQAVSKYSNEQGHENDVFVVLGILRLPSPVSTEILVSVTAPQRLAAGSSESLVVSSTLSADDAVKLIMSILATLRVRNWSLFVPE